MPADEQLDGAAQSAFCRFLFADDRVPLHINPLVFAQKPVRFDVIAVHHECAEIVNECGLTERGTVVRSEIKAFGERVGNHHDASAVRMPIAFKFVHRSGKFEKFPVKLLFICKNRHIFKFKIQYLGVGIKYFVQS